MCDQGASSAPLETPSLASVGAEQLGLFVADPQGRLLEASATLLDLMEASEDDLNQKRLLWRRLLTPESLKLFNHALAEAQTHGTSKPQELELLGRKGERHPIALAFTRADLRGDRFFGLTVDLSFRARMQQALIRSNTRFREIFEHAPWSMQIFDAKGRMLMTNRAWAELWDIDLADDLTHEKVSEYNIFEDPLIEKAGLTPELRRTLDGEIVHVPPIRYTPSVNGLPGRDRWIQAQAYPIARDEGEVSEVVLVLEDITEKRLSQDALQASEERFRFLTESIPQVVFSATPDGQLDYCNHNGLEYTGLTESEILSGEFWSLIHPDDASKTAVLSQAALNSGEPFEISARIRRATDGAYRWILIRALPLRDKDGHVIKWFGTATDIDTQRQLQERQSFLAEASAVLNSSLDFQTTLSHLIQILVPRLADFCSVHLLEKGHLKPIAANHIDKSQIHAGWEILRKISPRGWTGLGPTEVLRTMRTQFLPEVDDALLRASTLNEEHYQMLKNFSPCSFVCVPMCSFGEILGTLSFVRTRPGGQPYTADDVDLMEDIASRAALAVGNARLYREAQAANHMKDEFLAILSHELRTPLTVILANADLLSRKKEALGELYPLVDAIFRNARTQTQIVNDLLDVSAIITGKFRFQPIPVDPIAVVNAAIESIRPLATARQHRLTTDFAEAPTVLLADPVRLQQVVWNLLSNSVKFSPPGGRISVSVRQEGQECLICIKDLGQGIDPAFLPHVFDRFRQEDSSRTRSHGGLGLGLAIVRHLVELHGGHTEAFSDGRGKGSTFNVTLPIREPALSQVKGSPPEATTDTNMTTTSSAGAGAQALQGLRILIVDDEKDTREVLGTVLRQAGAATALADSVSAADSLYLADHFDLVLCDIGLPDEDGYSFVQKVRQHEMRSGTFTPMVALTAHAREEDRRKALSFGFQMYLSKPIAPQMLIRELRRVIDLTAIQNLRS